MSGRSLPLTPVLLISILALAGQLANAFLYLRIQNAILESEARQLENVSRRHPAKAVCDARMEAMEHRLELLENRRPAAALRS